jgi:hypothetical protein
MAQRKVSCEVYTDRGIVGKDGAAGKSAYEQAVEGGYQGTEEEFEQALASDITTVASNISDVNAVGQSITDVNSVAGSLTDISTVANNVSDVNTVAGISSDVTQVSSISSAVQTVSGHDSEVTLVADNMASVMTTASSITDVQNVASDITNINTVAGISSDISTVATNSTAVNTAATNIAAIIAAPTAATNAANSAAEAQIWAEGTDGQVSPLGGEHSAKGWAEYAEELVETIGQVMHYKGSVATYADLTAIVNPELGDVYNVLADDSNYAWTGTAWDMIGSSVDLSAYRTAAAQDVIDASKLENKATGTNSLTVLGNATSNSYATNIGGNSRAEANYALAVGYGTIARGKNSTCIGPIANDYYNNNCTIVGYNAQSESNYGIAIGAGTKAAAVGAIQIGNNTNALITNSNAKTLQVFEYQLLDGNTGKIPAARLDNALPSQTGNNGKFLTTNGSAASWADIPTEVDNKSVTLNSSDQIQAVGVIDQNNTSNAIKTWTGTKDKFNDIVTKDAHTLYNVTDELDGGSVDTSFVASLGRCSYNFQQLAAVHGEEYTAPANGFFVLNGVLVNAANNRLYLLLRNKPYIYGNRLAHMAFGALSSYRQYVWLPVAKGDVVAITAQSTAPTPDFDLRFYYAIGEQIPTPEYTPIQYIQGQYNAQYIKSGIIPASGMKVYCKLQNTSSTLGFGWGCRNVTFDGAQMSVNATNQNVVVDWFGADSEDRWTLSTSVATTDIFELTIENNVAEIKKNGSVVGTHMFTPTATVTRELFLTGFNNNGMMGGAGATGRLYEYKLWAPEGNLLLDMTPAKDADGVACLYNSVNKILYYNQGTGSYTAGPDAN